MKKLLIVIVSAGLFLTACNFSESTDPEAEDNNQQGVIEDGEEMDELEKTAEELEESTEIENVTDSIAEKDEE